MTEIVEIYPEEDDAYAIVTDKGVRWSGVSAQSRFWPLVLDWIEQGNTLPEYVEPSASIIPADYPLNPAQFEAILSLIGITVDQIDAAIDSVIPDATANAFAKAKVRKATSYNRDNELFGLLVPVMNITDAQIDAAWLQAKDLR